MADKNYVGSGWQNEKYDFINLSLNLEKLKQLPVNQYGDVKVTVAKMKKPNAKSKATHSVYENTFEKVNAKDYQGNAQDDDMPF